MNYNFIGNKIDETTRKYFFKKLPIIAYGADSLTKVGENDYVAVWKSTESGGRFELPYDQNVWYLAVGGGGAGGTVTSAAANSKGAGGGGGAGGFVEVNPQTLNAGLYTVTVGAGGLAATSQVVTPGGKGGNSIIYSEATASEIVKAIGGGGGGANSAGGEGGSGGGGSYDGVNTPTKGGNSLSSQGNAGGDGWDPKYAGAGGGAGGVGTVSGWTSDAQPGGVGKQSQILDVKVDDDWPYYAGGGGGGRAAGSKVDSGGKGGGGMGGRGSSTAPVAAEPGDPNTGGGGGGGGRWGVGANGGSGIVIVRFLNPPSIPILKECPFDVSYGTLSGLSSEYFETGSPIVPEISVYNSKGKLLTENTDWQKILENNTWAGTASLSVVGIGSYYGQLTRNFEIVKPKYTILEYIESTGTQYLNTTYTHTSNTRVYMKTYIFSDQGSYGQWGELFGAFSTSYSNNAMSFFGTFGYPSNKYMAYSRSGNEASKSMGSTYYDTILDIDCYNKTASISCSTTQTTINTSGTCDSGIAPLGILVINKSSTRNGWNPDYRRILARIYQFNIYENDILKMNLIPIKDENGVVCMYDKVTNTYFYNKGTGNFIAGPIKTN